MSEACYEGVSFEEGTPSGALVDEILDALSRDQARRWRRALRTSGFLEPFLLRESDASDEAALFEHAREWATATALLEPGLYFEGAALRTLRKWMDGESLWNGLEALMAEAHRADPVGLIERIMGERLFHRFENEDG
jgi:hypothetical protein